MLPRPVNFPRWATDISALITEPSEGKKDIGWIAEEPPADFENWRTNLVYQWLVFLNSAAGEDSRNYFFGQLGAGGSV